MLKRESEKRVFTSSNLSFHLTAVARATELMVVTGKGSPIYVAILSENTIPPF